MQLYAFFALVLFALAARAATIPDNTQTTQENLQKLRESFNTQIDTLTENIGTFLNGNRSNNFSPAEERTKADLQNIRSGLITFKNDFTKGLKILDDYIQFKAANQFFERSYPSSGAGNMQAFITNFATNVQNGFATVTNSLNNYVTEDQNAFNQGQQVSIDSAGFVTPAEASAPVSSSEASATMSTAEASASMSSAEASVTVSSAASPAGVPTAEILADLSLPSLSSLSGDVSIFSKFIDAYHTLKNAYNTCIKKPVQSAQELGSAAGITPFKQRIAETVLNLDLEKPRELEKVEVLLSQDEKTELSPDSVLLSQDEKTELSPDSGDSNNSSDGGVKGVKYSESVNEVQQKLLPEEAAKPKKTKDIIEKTE